MLFQLESYVFVVKRCQPADTERERDRRQGAIFPKATNRLLSAAATIPTMRVKNVWSTCSVLLHLLLLRSYKYSARWLHINTKNEGLRDREERIVVKQNKSHQNRIDILDGQRKSRKVPSVPLSSWDSLSFFFYLYFIIDGSWKAFNKLNTLVQCFFVSESRRINWARDWINRDSVATTYLQK